MSGNQMSPDQAAAYAAEHGGDPDGAYWAAADRINAAALADHNTTVRAELHVKRMAARQAAPAVSGELLPVVLSGGGGRSSEQSR